MKIDLNYEKTLVGNIKGFYQIYLQYWSMHSLVYSSNKQLGSINSKIMLNPSVSKQDEGSGNWINSFNEKQTIKRQPLQSYSSISYTNEGEKVMYELSNKEKEMIASLSKIFLAQNPHPKKIMVKINEMKRCHLKDQHQSDCPNCRIDRIQISTLPQNYKISAGKRNAPFRDVPQITDVILDMKMASELESSILQINDISTSMRKTKKHKLMKIIKTVAILFKPETPQTGLSRCRSANQIAFNKFRKPVHDSVQSNVSINNETLLDQLNGESTSPSKEVNFTKLLELSSFVKKKHIEKQLLATSTVANQKMSIQFKNLKSQMNSERLVAKSKIEELTKEMEKTKNELQSQRSAKLKFKQQIAALQKKLKEIREINDIFLKQNNSLKQKLKQNMKIVQELRRDIAKESSNIEQPTEDKLRPNSPKITARVTQKSIQQDLRKAVSAANTKSPNKQTQRMAKIIKNGVQPQNNYYPNFMQEINKEVQKQTIRTAHLIHRGYDIEENYRQPPSKQASVKSQRVVGIRKNSPRVDPNLVQQKNLVKVASYSNLEDHNNSNMMYSSKNEGQNKSQSNFSGLSGSLSQRVGFIQKPITEAKRGMLIDYMLEEMPEKNEGQKKQDSKIAKQDKDKQINIKVNEVQRFLYKQAK